MKVVLISGRARSGKDTVAYSLDWKLKRLGKRVLVTHFADILKYICEEYLDWDGEKNEEGRSLLQHVGTDIVRKENPDFWVDFLIMLLRIVSDRYDVVIIADCRFKNEILGIFNSGFDAIHLQVERDGFNNCLSDEQKNHISENDVKDFAVNHYIKNNGALVDIDDYISENILKEIV